MINELRQLSVAMAKANINAENWHREYKPLPNIKASAPCVRIVLNQGRVTHLESVDAELGLRLRKYGNNQGTFPAMNLAPLYRVSDPEQTKELARVLKAEDGRIDWERIQAWRSCGNWGNKFLKKYKICMRDIPAKLGRLLQGDAAYEPALRLIQAAEPFADPQLLRQELEKAAMRLLEDQVHASLALRVLFYAGAPEKKAEEDFGALSVILDSQELEDEGDSSATVRFTQGLNQALLKADDQEKNREEAGEKDAFGVSFAPLEEPMPSVKLAGGFDVTLRTMFKGQPCQYRYGRIENATYPIAPQLRSHLKAALTWISSAEMKEKTWVSCGDNEILFVYPFRPCANMPSFTGPFQPRYEGGRRMQFESEARAFSEYLTKTKAADPENYPDNIQIFMLRKLDKARTKAVYSRCASPEEIVRRSEEWRRAAKNLPSLPRLYPFTPYPLPAAKIMNRTWKQDGTQATDKSKPVANFHGMELLFGVPRQTLENDLHFMMDRCANMALYAGKLLNPTSGLSSKSSLISDLQEALMLIGMLLYWLGDRKEEYMNEYPYLLGQLLKLSDSLHELYCVKVRDGQIPPQLVGNAMYLAASETPTQTLAQLAARMVPYIAWARANRNEQVIYKWKDEQGEARERSGPAAGYLLHVFGQTAGLLEKALKDTQRFTDYEKAQLFIGYLASFAQKTDTEQDDNQIGGKDDA